MQLAPLELFLAACPGRSRQQAGSKDEKRRQSAPWRCAVARPRMTPRQLPPQQWPTAASIRIALTSPPPAPPSHPPSEVVGTAAGMARIRSESLGSSDGSSDSGSYDSDASADVSSSPTPPPPGRAARGRLPRPAGLRKGAPTAGGLGVGSPGRYAPVQFVDSGHPGQPVHVAAAYQPAPGPPGMREPGLGPPPGQMPPPGVYPGFAPPQAQPPVPGQHPPPPPSMFPALMRLPPPPPPLHWHQQPHHPQHYPQQHLPGQQSARQPPTHSLQPPAQGEAALQPSWMLLEAQLRAASLHDIIHRRLLPKRKQLQQQVEAVEARSDEVRAACQEAARKVQQQAEERLQRLAALEAGKLSALQRQGDALQADLEAIRHVLCETSRVVGSEAVAAGLELPRLNAVEDAATSLSDKVHSSELPASAEGFADMVDDYEELMERHCSLAKLLYVKDQMIWKLLDERSALQSQVQQREARGAVEEHPSVAAAQPQSGKSSQPAMALVDSLRNMGVMECTEDAAPREIRPAEERDQSHVPNERGVPTSAPRCDSVWVPHGRRSASGDDMSRRGGSSVPPRVSSSNGVTSSGGEEKDGKLGTRRKAESASFDDGKMWSATEEEEEEETLYAAGYSSGSSYGRPV
eukprot:jgi/Tetstr1/463438/TSEL_000741.t1